MKTLNIFLEVIDSLRSNFEQSVIDGNLQCEVVSAPIPEPIQPLVNRPPGPRTPVFNPGWISERFGHMCCYYGKALKIEFLIVDSLNVIFTNYDNNVICFNKQIKQFMFLEGPQVPQRHLMTCGNLI